MKTRKRFVSITVLLLCAITGSTTLALGRNSQQRDPLRGLKRALTEANAPALTSDQETQLNTLITNFQNALPEEPDATLEAARTAFDDAVLAGNLTAAQAQAQVLANRTAELANARLRAEAQFEISALALLKSGGQLDLLTQRFGNDRLLELIGSLVGHSFDGGPHGFGPR